MQNVKHSLRYNTIYSTSSIFFKIFIFQNYYHHSFGPPAPLPLSAENYLLNYLTEIFFNGFLLCLYFLLDYRYIKGRFVDPIYTIFSFTFALYQEMCLDFLHLLG